MFLKYDLHYTLRALAFKYLKTYTHINYKCICRDTLHGINSLINRILNVFSMRWSVHGVSSWGRHQTTMHKKCHTAAGETAESSRTRLIVSHCYEKRRNCHTTVSIANFWNGSASTDLVIDVPDFLDLSRMRATGLQAGEEELPDLMPPIVLPEDTRGMESLLCLCLWYWSTRQRPAPCHHVILLQMSFAVVPFFFHAKLTENDPLVTSSQDSPTVAQYLHQNRNANTTGHFGASCSDLQASY